MKLYSLFLALIICPLLGALSEENAKRKKKEAELLVNAASEYLAKNDIFNACHTFSKDPSWRKGDLSITLIKSDGTIYTNPDDQISIWQNITETENSEFSNLLEKMENRGSEGGGWIVYPWKNDLKYAYTKSVIKETESYFVTCGFYPQSKKFQTKQLIKNFIHYIEDTSLPQAIKEITQPEWQRGAIYLEVYKTDGTCIGNGKYSQWVGKNMIDLKDQKGIAFIKKAIEISTTSSTGWISYTINNSLKKAYVASYTDQNNQENYVIMAGYYPAIKKNMLPKFVKKAINFLVMNGIEAAISAFNDLSGQFIMGPLQIIVLDETGIPLTQTYKGNTLDKGFFKKCIESSSLTGAGWTYGQDRYTECGAYTEKITCKDITYFITTIYYLNSKKSFIENFVSNAASYLETHDTHEAFKAFSDPRDSFYYGTNYIFVYDFNGRCKAHGENLNFLQRILLDQKDQKGIPIIQNIITMNQKNFMGWTSCHLRNSTKEVFTKVVHKKDGKETKSYIIGSGYWI